MVKKRTVYMTVFSIVFLLALLLRTGLIQATSNSHEGLASEFLRDVAGFNMDSYSIASFYETTARMPDSQHYLTVMNAEITGNNTQFEAHIDLIDGRMWTYDLSGNFSAGELNDSELLIAANNHLNAYQTFSEASFCSGLIELLSTAIQTQTSTVENENFSLRISNSGGAVTVDYSRKVNGYTLPGDCFAIHVSKNGLLGSLLDNTMYCIATTVINVTRDEAIALAMPNATATANKFGQTIAVTNATLVYVRDLWSVRGDDFAMYPEWSISFTFDKGNNESVSEYDVSIWADNGQVYYSQPQGYYAPSNAGPGAGASWQVLAFAAGLFVLFPLAVIFARRRARTGRSGR
jgi:hypothetical protein